MKGSTITNSASTLPLSLTGCDKLDPNKLYFATSAKYPSFEYNVNGKLAGFGIELGEMIAKELSKKVEFKDS